MDYVRSHKDRKHPTEVVPKPTARSTRSSSPKKTVSRSKLPKNWSADEIYARRLHFELNTNCGRLPRRITASKMEMVFENLLGSIGNNNDDKIQKGRTRSTTRNLKSKTADKKPISNGKRKGGSVANSNTSKKKRTR